MTTQTDHLRENMLAACRDRVPRWMPLSSDQLLFCPSVIPDHGARGFVFEAQAYPRERFGGKDMFGVEWEYVDIVGGSTVKPGHPLLENANDWETVLHFPDLDAWDWAASGQQNAAYLEDDRCRVITLLNGCWFERLVSFMDFGNACMALVDEDQTPAVRALLHKLTDLYIAIVDKCAQVYALDGVCIHDDWGSQRAPLFSDDVARDIFLPEMQRFVTHVHSKGWICELHSCGKLEDRCPVFIEAGFDSWTPMAINDMEHLYDTYGDRMVFGIPYDCPFDPLTASEAEQRAAARAVARHYAQPGKPCILSFRSPTRMVPDCFLDELQQVSAARYRTVTLTRATQQDCPQIYDLQIRSFRTLLDKYQDHAFSPGAEPYERTLQRFAESFTHFWLISVAGTTIGAIRVCDFGALCKLKQIFILPEWQQMGYAQQAVRQVEALYPQAERWELDTILQEDKLRHLYEKMGYVPTGEIRPIQDDMDLIFYAKDKKQP